MQLRRLLLAAIVGVSVALLTKAGPAMAQTTEAPGKISQTFVTFIGDAYLNPAIETDADIARLYGARINYYGKRTDRAAVIADKARYYRRWPERSYVLHPDTIKVVPRAGTPNEADVSFEFDFRVARGGEARTGRGRTRLGLTAVDGELVIVAEDGVVLKRP